jgi:hypothetical protein
MINKDLILSKIKELAEENGGKPPGLKNFTKITSIKSNQICGKYWARWNDAVIEAGFKPNHLPEGHSEDFLCSKLAEFIKESGRYPARGEISHRAFNDKSFPGISCYINTLGCRFVAAKKVLDYCSAREGLNDVAEICNKIYQDGIAEDEEYANYFEGIKYFIGLEKTAKNQYLFTARQKPYMINQLKLEGKTIVHQIAADSRSFAYNLLMEKYKSFFDKMKNRFTFSVKEISEIKKYVYIKGS